MNPQTETHIGSLEAAQRKVIGELITCGFELKDIFPINKKRYSILTSKKKNILLTFKREPFFTFEEKFKHLGKMGNGDSINCEELDIAKKMQVTDIITVFSDGIAYTIPLTEFMEKSVKWENNEGKKVRSVSLNEYKKVFVF